MSGLVWLASYPKSGNTWLRLALRSLAEGGAAVDINDRWHRFAHAASRALFDAELKLESSDLTRVEIEAARSRLYRIMLARPAPPLILKVHDARLGRVAGEPMLPAAPTIYVVRDPRDVAVSLAHHWNLSLDATIGAMADEDYALSAESDRLPANLPQRLASWSLHAESWLGASDMPVHRVRYEDMQAAPVTVLAEIATVAGIPWNAETAARAVAATDFKTLRVQEERYGFRERLSREEPFFRRGIAGGWRDVLTPTQADRIARDHGPVMARLGYLR